MDLSRFSNEELDALLVQDFSKLSDSNLDYVSQNLDFFKETKQASKKIVEPEKQGIMGSFAGGIGKTLLGAGETLGIVEPETYAKYAEGFKQDEIQNPIASGLGKGVGVMVGALPAMAVANPIGAGALAIGGAAGMGGTARRAEVMHDTGGDASAANKAGLSEAFWSGAGVALPVSLAGNLLKRLVTGGAGNIAFNELDIAHQNQILEEYPTLQSPNFDLKSMTVSGVLGAVTGGVFGKRAGVAPAAKGDVDGKELPPQDLAEGEVPANRDFKTLTQDSIVNAEKTISRAEYKIGEIETDLKTKQFDSPEQAEQYRAAKLEERAQHIEEIQAMSETIKNGKAMLEGETPKAKPEGEVPSGPPPRPQDDTFVRPTEEAIPAEQATNAEMFDTAPVREEGIADATVVAPEPTTIGPTAIKEEIGTDPSISVEEAPSGAIPISENIEMKPLESMDEIEFLTREEAQARLDQVDPSAPNSITEMRALSKHIESLGEEVDAPVGVVIKGGTKAEQDAVHSVLKEVGLDKERIDIDLADPRQTELGTADAVGNTAKVSIAAKKVFDDFISSHPRFKTMVEKMGVDQVARFEKMFTAAHEIGHVMLFKLIQTDLYKGDLKNVVAEFEAWKKTNRSEVDQAAGVHRDFDQLGKDYYAQFPEFFAQRVARAILLGEKSPNSKITKYVKDMKTIWNRLRDHFGLPITLNNMVDDFIGKIISDNKAQLKKTGETIFEIQSTKMALEDAKVAHNLMFNYKGIDELGKAGAPANMKAAVRHIESAEAILEQQKAGLLIRAWI